MDHQIAAQDRELLAFAESFGPKIGARSTEIEEIRHLPPDINDEFESAGVYHALVPREYGGLEVHPATLLRLIKTISHHSGSAGWNVMIGCTTGLLSASLPEAYAQEIYGGARKLTVGVTAPMGKAEVVEGGYRVSGRWPFGSGSHNASWIVGGCFVFEAGEQRLGKHGEPALYLMMFEREQVNIEDTWHVSGLKGTGSNHFNVDDQFVPDGRCVVMGGRPHFQRPLYQFPMLGLLALGVSSVSLGIGYKALAAFKQLADVKKPTGSVKTLVNRSSVQSAVAQSMADLESAEAYIHQVVTDCYAIAAKGERLAPEHKARLRLAAANATHRSVAAVDRLYQAGGGTSIYEDCDLQLCFRDVHVTTQHLMVAAPIYEVIGRVELGLPPNSLL